MLSGGDCCDALAMTTDSSISLIICSSQTPVSVLMDDKMSVVGIVPILDEVNLLHSGMYADDGIPREL